MRFLSLCEATKVFASSSSQRGLRQALCFRFSAPCVHQRVIPEGSAIDKSAAYLMGSLLIATLFFQFKARKYVAGTYWLAVVLLSIVGTLITDNLTDNFGVSLVTTTIVFSVLLTVTYLAWHASEKTLSVHTIHTTRRETFYWLAILFTFALGTAAGDLVAEKLQLGYLLSAFIFAALIALAAFAHLRFRLNAIFAFWFAYILTRPLGASIGDFMSQPVDHGALGFGTVLTSALFLVTILGLVIFLTVTRKDVSTTPAIAG